MCRFRRPGMGRKMEMVQGDDDLECLSFFSYIEDEKMGRPLGDLDRSRKPFWREFDEYMHERGEKSSNLFLTREARVSVRNPRGDVLSTAQLVLDSFSPSDYIQRKLVISFHTLYAAPLNACASKSAGSVGTDKIRNVFVCPRPPFQPCTAIIAHPGLIKFKERALRSPNRMRLST